MPPPVAAVAWAVAPVGIPGLPHDLVGSGGCGDVLLGGRPVQPGHQHLHESLDDLRRELRQRRDHRRQRDGASSTWLNALDTADVKLLDVRRLCQLSCRLLRPMVHNSVGRHLQWRWRLLPLLLRVRCRLLLPDNCL